MAATPTTAEQIAALKDEVEGIIVREIQTLRTALDAQGADFTKRSEATVGMLQAEAKVVSDETMETFAKKLKEKETFCAGR